MATTEGVAEDLAEEVLGRIDADRELLAETCLELGNTFGPCGHEQPVADAVSAWYDRYGIPSFQQNILADRSNVVARVPGRGGGRNLIFNAHLDTEISGPDHRNLMDSADPNLVGAWRDGDRLFGHTVLNDRGCMSVFMVMAKALRDAGTPLAGDVVLTSVAGETGMAPVDEYQGMNYDGKGFGSKFLVDHGVRADFALVAETTSWSMSWIECGCCYLKVTVRGRNMYTPRLIRGASLADQPNAIVRGAAVVTALEEWAVGYEERNAFRSAIGEVRPKAQVGAVRGGVPYRPNRSSTVCKIYLDVRTVPGADQDAVVEEVRTVVAGVDPSAEVDCFMAKQGFAGTGVEPLADAVAGAYDAVIGGPTPEPDVPSTSMWRDTNVFNAVGIPSLTFGPSRGSAAVQGTGHFDLDDLVAAAKIYALTVLRLCR
jgi:acetylornithine deacetylase/succinyl-diaminopimelate desuccinylase-like protein